MPQVNLAASLGRWSARHRVAAVVGWLVFVVLATALGSEVGQLTMTRVEYGTGESGRAMRMLADAHVAQPAQELVLVRSATLGYSQPAFAKAVQDVLSGVRATGQVTNVRPPVPSPSGHDVLLAFAMTGDPQTAANRVAPVLAAVHGAQRANPTVTIAQFGDASANKWFNDTVLKDFKRAEWTAVPLALGILLVVFGSLLAASLPVVLALTAFFAANGLLAIVSHAMHVDTSASSVMLLMGLAVGVDYCLFYLRREREERAAGHDPRASLDIAAATSGRSVLISGLTVIVAMSGMFLSGMQLFAGFAVATISVVLIAMIGSVTVLPALMSMLGDRVELGKIPFLRRTGSSDGSRVWNAILHRVLARPALSATLAAGVLLGIASPALGLHTETLSIDKILPASTSIVRTYQQISKTFPGGPAPAVVVVRAPDVNSAETRAAIASFQSTARASGLVGQPILVTAHPTANIVEIDAPLVGSGSDAVSRHALAVLHNSIVPATLGRIPGGTALVAGNLAASQDFTNTLRRGIVPVFVFVMGITFLVMLFAFGSIVIPTVTIALNLLSVGAAYGAMVAVFQRGWGVSWLGTTAPGAIESWIPLFVFVVLFGLSMDYHVFVVSRIKEAHDRGRPTGEAVAHGIRTAAGVVTSAAAIMVAVFAVFGTLSLQQFKQLSVGLAVAVLLDATIVRGVLLPSVMTVLGEHNWYLPRWMSRLPGMPTTVLSRKHDQPEVDGAADRPADLQQSSTSRSSDWVYRWVRPSCSRSPGVGPASRAPLR
jgi:RND superfamily putative drug exporter